MGTARRLGKVLSLAPHLNTVEPSAAPTKQPTGVPTPAPNDASEFVGTVTGYHYRKNDPVDEYDNLCRAAFAGSHWCYRAELESSSNTSWKNISGYVEVHIDAGKWTSGYGWH